MTRGISATIPHFLRLFESACRLRQQGKESEAQKLYATAAKTCPEFWFGIGSSALKNGDRAEAMKIFLDVYEHADSTMLRSLALNNIGSMLSKTDRRAATRYIREAHRLHPKNAETMCNYALTLAWELRFPEAIDMIDKATRLKPQLHAAHFCRALWYLTMGEFEKGWSEYEERFLSPDSKLEKIDGLEWDGRADLNGKTLFLYGEQGVGDTIHFARYGRLFRDLGAKVYVAVQRGLKDVIVSTDLFDGVIDVFSTDELPKYDYVLPLMSCGRVFQTNLTNIPPAPYLQRPTRTAEGFRVGLVWAGSPDHAQDAFRSIPLEKFRPLLDVPGVQFVSLQKGPKVLELITSELPIENAAARINDYTDTMRELANLDLLISVDTSVVHLAGAMGVPCWALISYQPDWRWLLNRDDSPWYPSIRLFRQPAEGDWESVIARVSESLNRYQHEQFSQ